IIFAAKNNTSPHLFYVSHNSDEAMLKKITNDPKATYYPKGKSVYVEDKNNKGTYKLTYRFDIYASKPMQRKYVFVDAQNGNVILDINRIHNTDVPGTAVTKYSGTQPIMTDSTAAGSYRLRETTRGNGIETYNMKTGTAYGSAVDFTDTDNYWNNVNTEKDEIATDAHWGAEMTYDYYKNTFNRNSIDGNGFKLISYVHYDVNYDNAYWDGTCMTYGDGDGSTYTPFTALDICGHEITHGLDEKTANLTYQDESGALNEGFSDIFGCAIEWYAKPATANWTMGEDIGTIIRSLSTPKAYSCPNTYGGSFWYTGTQDNGGVHTNSSVVGYWYYLLAHGGSGTNDNSISYNITGLGMNAASEIAYRTLTAYLPSSANYADTRYYSIVAAIDLYGPCSPEVETVANAWYACGVGGPYDSTVVAGFTPSFTTFCTIPAEVTFTNSSTNTNIYHWDFGDGTTDTLMNPIHIYNSYGKFTVTLIAGGNCGADTIVKTEIINVDSLNPCSTNMPETGTAANQTACSGILFDSGGSDNYQDETNSSITIQPTGAANITLTFSEFGFEKDYDYLKIYDGSSISNPLIGSYTGNTLPNGGTITSTYGAITIVQTSDVQLNDIGFICQWQCHYPTTPPEANFQNDTISCTGEVKFLDLTTNGPLTWLWKFGDGDTSTLQNPTHLYVNDGTYDVQLITGNTLGYDTLTKTMCVTVDKPVDPTATSAWRCSPGSVTLTASGSSSLSWFDAPIGGNLVYVGNTFITPYLNNTTTFYVQDVVAAPSLHVGPADNSMGNGSYSYSTTQRYLVFDCSNDIEIASVLVFSDSSFTRTISLANSSGTILQDTAILIPAGQSRVYIHFPVPAGTGYRLIASTSNGLFRNQNGAVYPYTLQDIVSITGSNSQIATAYYYFYDWEIVGGNCASNRVPSVATIHLPAPTVTPSGIVKICDGESITLTCQQADSYLWSPGGQTTQSISVNTEGFYTVLATDSICSTPSDSVEVEVVNNPPIASFTNTANFLNVSFTNASTNSDSSYWNFGDGATSQLVNPTHTYAASGTYTVTLITENVCGTDTFTVSITVEGNGISENSSNSGFVIYPNPSNGTFIIDALNFNSTINYSVYDLLGNIIKSGIINNSKTIIDLEGTPKGIYFIRLSNETINNASRIIIQ
ncbi:MAG TPA: M4 family metallopeptidase, partial [Bacteroidales bacterium]|nr:M4 family metallopeptidase [Bacteroidales bacterium]HPS17737.1 M4 family metallopeptidase [Bacteroidales bacterium]